MVRITPVALQTNPRLLWFDPGELDIRDGDTVIVKTDRGTDFGRARGIVEVTEEEVSNLRSRLKPVERVATDEDLERIEELRQRGRDALPVFKRMAAEVSDEMHPVMVEFLFDGDRATFLFESEQRVDFRDLVRKLAAEFHVRVDMRQIGVRDEARIVGGLGHCGQELCCRRLGGDFNPVSIRMAKEQDLSLNPQKISGLCGRLMCCLRYEFDAYKDFKCRAPKQGARIDTPDGTAKVTGLNVPKEEVSVRLEDGGKQVTFPLSAMDAPSEGSESKRPTSIGEAFEQYANPDPFAGAASLGVFDRAGFTGTDKLGKPEARMNPRSQRSGQQGAAAGGQEGEGRRRRRRRGKGKSGQGAAGQGAAAQKGQQQGAPAQGDARKAPDGEPQGTRKRRRRRSGGGQGGQGGQGPNGGQGGQGAAKAVRPGQKSSGLAQGGVASGRAQGDGAPASDAHRKSRRRTHKSGGEQPAE